MLGTIGLQKLVFGLREYVSQVCVPDPILNSLPDGLWVFAFTNWIIFIWNGRPPWQWLVCGVALGIGSEIGQAFSIVPGTFDFCDLFFYFAGFALAYINLGARDEEAFVLARRNDCDDIARFW